MSQTVIDQIKTTNKLPEKSVVLKVTPPTDSQLSKWNNDLKGIFGNIANIGWSTMTNLDGDEFVEAIVCTPTPKSKTCFVYDEVNSKGRYYDSGFKWDGKTAPTVFTLNKKSYIHHTYPLKKGAVHKLMLFDGSGYNSIQF